MKNVTFKKISIQNFLSIGEEKVELNFSNGINIVTGINLDKPDRRNGIGKSTIADSVYFAIFGETLRDIKKDLVINNLTGGMTQVTLEFDIDVNNTVSSYKLTRTLNPSKVFISQNGIDITRDTLANTNKYVNDLLSATPNVFKNCVIMTVNDAIPFMAKNKIEKRKFIEDIFGLEVFSNMLSILRAEYNDLKRQYDIENSKVSEITTSLANYKQQQQKTIDRRVDKLGVYKVRQSENKVQKDKIQKSLESFESIDIDSIKQKITKLVAGIATCDEKLSENITNLSEIKTKIKFLTNTLNKIGTNEHECPICLREIKDHDLQHIEDEKIRLKKEIADHEVEIKDIDNVVNALKSKKDEINRIIKNNENIIVQQRLQDQNKQSLIEKINQIDKWQESLIIDIEQVSGTDTEFDSIIDETSIRLNELTNKLTDLNNNFNILDVVKYVISEEGVKSYIVNKLLDLLNGRLAYYINKLDCNAVCRFNEFFEEEIVNDKNKICSYFNFSGAERKSIDLACLFTFSDLRRMQGGIQYNIAMYDELFDSSFDEKCLEHVTDLLRERAEKFNECIYIISHRKESIKSVTGDVIYLQKSGGITKRVNFVENQM